MGLSLGITSPTAPLLVKLVQIVQMWLGRLEFLSAFALLLWTASLVRGLATRRRAAAT